VQYDRVTFTAGLDGGQAIFYKKNSAGAMEEAARYKAIFTRV